MKMKYLILSLSLSIVLFACSSGNKCKSDHFEKLDALSIQNLLAAEKESPEEVLDIVILLYNEADNKTIGQVEKYGATIITKVSNIIAARAKPIVIRKLLHHKSIKSIEINKELSL